MQIAELSDLRARGDADGPCLAHDVAILDNAAFARRVRRAAAALRARGVGTGDVVALLLPPPRIS
ncbi:hypothetical protein [Streptomyces sp. NPDC002685]|uniref:hypothetical protein n=1 Tax=Streptomyces sp. NPDC002685 TaxID=3154540 RepID=UPI003330810D